MSSLHVIIETGFTKTLPRMYFHKKKASTAKGQKHVDQETKHFRDFWMGQESCRWPQQTASSIWLETSLENVFICHNENFDGSNKYLWMYKRKLFRLGKVIQTFFWFDSFSFDAHIALYPNQKTGSGTTVFQYFYRNLLWPFLKSPKIPENPVTRSIFIPGEAQC